MAERVVDVLEAVEVEEDEREAVLVAAGALELEPRAPSMNAWWFSRPVSGSLRAWMRELRGGAVEVGEHAFDEEPVDGVGQAPARRADSASVSSGRAALRDEAPEHATEQEELGHDLAGREAERLPLARVVACLRGERATDAQASGHRVGQPAAELGDERRRYRRAGRAGRAARATERRRRGDPPRPHSSRELRRPRRGCFCAEAPERLPGRSSGLRVLRVVPI